MSRTESCARDVPLPRLGLSLRLDVFAAWARPLPGCLVRLSTARRRTRDAAVLSAASAMHGLWQASRPSPEGGFVPRWERQRDGRLVDVANSRFDLLPRSAQESWKGRAAALVDVAEAYPHADAVDLAALAHSDDRGSSMLFVDLSSNEQMLRVAFAEAVRRVLAEMQRSARREFS